jgi:peptidoglycan/xylan/chitin deacetylase (PgdA/CDA1 family)
MERKVNPMVHSFPILTFHAIEDQPSIISFPPKVFEHGMAKLHEKGYQTIGLMKVIECLRQKRPFPDRSFTITFDDGYQTVYQEAFPVLQRYGMSATVFLTVGRKGDETVKDRLPSLQGRPMLTWQRIREMHRDGIEFGAHTCTHPDLPRLSLEQGESEILDSKEIIENALGISIPFFAYPYGRYDHRIRQIVQAHFAGACSDRLGLVRFHSDPYAIERVETYYLRTPSLFDLMLTKFFPGYLLCREVPRTLRRFLQWR